ncbi:MAG: flagellar protein FlaG [Gammaproteobacteria bacterium]|nr:flagellar protein FlaG [Gammaproteobacteria bacterium]
MATEITAVNTVVNRQVAATTSSARSDAASTGRVEGNTSSAVRNNGEEQVKVREPDQQEVDQAVQNLNDYVQNIERNLEFSVDRNNGNTVISVIDSQTEEVIRQIPPEKAVNAVRNLQRLEGLLLSAEA